MELYRGNGEQFLEPRYSLLRPGVDRDRRFSTIATSMLLLNGSHIDPYPEPNSWFNPT